VVTTGWNAKAGQPLACRLGCRIRHNVFCVGKEVLGLLHVKIGSLGKISKEAQYQLKSPIERAFEDAPEEKWNKFKG